MSWLKRTIKKTGRKVGNVAKTAVNLAGSPITAFTGKTMISSKHFKGHNAVQRANKRVKLIKGFGKTAIAAGALVGGAALLGGGSVAAGLGKAGSSITKKLMGAKKFSSSIAQRLGAKKAVSKFIPRGSGTTSIAKNLNGASEGETILRTFIPADSKIGGMISKLPSLGEIFGGAADGATEVLQQSEAGQEVEEKAVKNWVEENQPKLLLGVIGVLAAGLGWMIAKK